MVTITNPEDVDLAVERGVDALCVQGIEAGAHRGGFTDDEQDDGYGLLALIGAVRERTSLPLVAAGGMGLAWVALIALIVLIEKLVPRAVLFSRAVGVAFVLGALVVMLRPELVAPMAM